MRPKLNVITLGVKDLKESINFYKHGLGWSTSAAETDEVAFFPLGGIILALYPRHLLAEDATVDASGGGFSGITLAQNAKSEAEVDETLETVAKAGGKIIKPAQKVFWGGYSGYFADPDGYLWEVAYNPYWGFDEQDNVILNP